MRRDEGMEALRPADPREAGRGAADGGAARALLLVATFALGRLHGVLSPREFMWLVAAWAVVCAGMAVGAGRFMQDQRFRPRAEADAAP